MADMQETLQRGLDALTSFGAIGTALSVDIQGQRICTLSSGSRDLAHAEALRPDHLFQIGSQTKMWVATAVLLLESRGLLGLETDIASLLPHTESLTGGQKITVSQLLNHSSGLGNYSDLFTTRGWVGVGWPPSTYTDDQLLALARARGADFVPGTQTSYSNTNYILLGQVIESITGQRSLRFIREHVLEPLGMTDTYFGRDADWPRARTAQGGIVFENAPPDQRHPQSDPVIDMSWASSAGDGIASLDQMLAFADALLGKRKKLAVNYTSHMRAPRSLGEAKQSSNFADAYGYGMIRFTFDGKVWLGHSGGTNSQISITVINPDLDSAFSMFATYTASARNASMHDALGQQRYALCNLVAREIGAICTGG